MIKEIYVQKQIIKKVMLKLSNECLPVKHTITKSKSLRSRFKKNISSDTQHNKLLRIILANRKARVADPDLDIFGLIRIRKIFTGSGSYQYFGNVKLYKQGQNIFKIELLHSFR